MPGAVQKVSRDTCEVCGHAIDGADDVPINQNLVNMIVCFDCGRDRDFGRGVATHTFPKVGDRL